LKDNKYTREMITLSKILLDIMPITSNSNDHCFIINDGLHAQPKNENKIESKDKDNIQEN